MIAKIHVSRHVARALHTLVHDLRHTAASLSLAAGFPAYQVSRWLGRASCVTTDAIYSSPVSHGLLAAYREVRGVPRCSALDLQRLNVGGQNCINDVSHLVAVGAQLAHNP